MIGDLAIFEPLSLTLSRPRASPQGPRCVWTICDRTLNFL